MRLVFVSQYPGRPFESVLSPILKKKNIELDFVSIKSEGPKKKFSSKKDVILGIFMGFFKSIQTLKSLKKYDKLFCIGGFFSILLAMKFIRRKDFEIYFYYFFLHSLANNKVIQFILKVLLHDPRLHLILQSDYEIAFYKHLAPNLQAEFCAYYSDVESFQDCELKKNYIFAGGYTNRAYSLVIELAKRFPKECFKIIASNLNKDIPTIVPENVEVCRETCSDEFNNCLAHAKVVIVPIKYVNVGASGQMLSLTAARNKCAVLYGDYSAINYYFANNAGISYEVGNVESAEVGLRTLLESEKFRIELGKKAYANSLLYQSKYLGKKLVELVFDRRKI